MTSRTRTGTSLVAVALVVLGLATPATASMLIDRNARNVKLSVIGRGVALVSYRDERGRDRRVLAWGAINSDSRFQLDYSGGRGTLGQALRSSTADCARYDGPALPWLVAACKAPDGTFWALQRWQRLLPGQGYEPFTRHQAAWDLRLSHWRGPLPTLEVYLDWIYGGKYHHLFGRYTYAGRPVFGLKSTRQGAPLDALGRNIYLDVLDSPHGPGWRRENGFLTHRPNGNFCYGFFPRRSYYDDSMRPAGHGRRYRATAVGPGVAPDPMWISDGLGAYDPEHERRMNALSDTIAAGDPLCRRH
jgi:hypothetical protein